MLSLISKKLLMQGKRGTKEMAEEFIGVPKEIIYQLLKNAGSQNKTQAGSCRVMVCRGRRLVCPAFL